MTTPAILAPGSRQQRAQGTRERLFVAACELFVAHGYVGTTVGSIAARAGVAKGTFFVHFRTKEAVATELIANQTRSARKARERALAEDLGPIAALVATVLELGKQAGSSKMLSRAVLAATLESSEVASDSSKRFEDVYALLLQDARAARVAGLLSKRSDPEKVAWSLLASYLGAALYFATNPNPVALVDGLRPLVEANLEAAGCERRQTRRRRLRLAP